MSNIVHTDNGTLTTKRLGDTIDITDASAEQEP